jgi:Guanylylate cyclase
MLFEWLASLRSSLFSVERSPNEDEEFKAIVRLLLPSHDQPSIVPHLQGDITFIPHVQQEFNWDCGVSCLQMAIVWLMHAETGPESLTKTNLPTYSKALHTWIMHTIATESIWTIDLLYALQKFLQRSLGSTSKMVAKSGVDDGLPFCDPCVHVLLTRSIATPKEYAHVQYYKLKFQEDRRRVSERLQQVRKHDRVNGCRHDSVRQWRHPLGIQQIVHCIQNKNCIAIALIDHTAFTSYGLLGDKSKPKHYVGHYILLTGISCDPSHIRKALSVGHAKMMNVIAGPPLEPSSNGIKVNDFCLVVQDPSHSIDAAPNFITLQHFEYAWRAYGTDEDILFIARQGNK